MERRLKKVALKRDMMPPRVGLCRSRDSLPKVPGLMGAATLPRPGGADCHHFSKSGKGLCDPSGVGAIERPELYALDSEIVGHQAQHVVRADFEDAQTRGQIHQAEYPTLGVEDRPCRGRLAR